MTTPVTDEQLIVASIAGDTAAFGQLYERYLSRIYKYQYYRTFQKETAEDLTSQTFIRALEGLRSYDAHKGNFSGWLYRIARNLLIDQARRTRPTTDLEEIAYTLSDRTDLARTAEQKEQLAHVQAALSTLTPDQREILILRLWDERTYAEIATILGKSEASCKMTASRALTQIRKTLPLPLFFLLVHLSLLPSSYA